MQLSFLTGWMPEAVLRALGWTLIHSLWEGLCAALLAGIIIVATRHSAARVRYNLLAAVMLIFIIGVMITYAMVYEPGVASIPMHNDNPLTNPGAIVTITTNRDNSAFDAWNGFSNWFNRHADVFVGVWAILCMLQLFRLLAGLSAVRRMRVYGVSSAPEPWNHQLLRLCAQLGIDKPVRMLQSELVKVPVAIGFFKPVILMPLGLLTRLPADQVETILLHELAHIRRRDFLLNILQRIAEAIFFFNPAIRWISAQLREEREACCDDVVVANTAHRGSYLEALVSFQEYALGESGYAMAIGTNRNYLLSRVKRMLTRENKKLNLMEKSVLLIGVVAVMAFSFIPSRKSPVDGRNLVSQSKYNADVKVAVPPSGGLTPSVEQRHSSPSRSTAWQTDAAMPMLSDAMADTTPTGEKRVSTQREGSTFTSITTNVNDENGVKTEKTTGIDRDGKKYEFTKTNEKITRLAVDGVEIPETDYRKYDNVIDRIHDNWRENLEQNELRSRDRLEPKKRLERLEREKNLRASEYDQQRERKEIFRQQGVDRKGQLEQLKELRQEKMNVDKAYELKRELYQRKSQERSENDRKYAERANREQVVTLQRKVETIRRMDAQRAYKVRALEQRERAKLYQRSQRINGREIMLNKLDTLPAAKLAFVSKLADYKLALTDYKLKFKTYDTFKLQERVSPLQKFTFDLKPTNKRLPKKATAPTKPRSTTSSESNSSPEQRITV